MKTYIATTGTIFGLLVIVHVWRVVEEPHFVRDPFFWLITVAAGAISVWAWSVLARSPRP